MKIKAYKKFKKYYQELPSKIQKKADKQIKLLSEDFQHPSLHTKKIKGYVGIWEARIDINYRITFEINGDTIFLRVIGSHDRALNRP